MLDQKSLEAIFHRHGFADFKWMNPKDIVVAQWVRMKCVFGCPGYGKAACCPPHTPTVHECRSFFQEYRRGVIIHIPKQVEKPEERHAWSRDVNLKLSALERDVFLSGYHKTFLLFMDSCSLCTDCSKERSSCMQAKTARPSPEGMAVDVFSTVRQYGFPIDVLTEYDQMMNRYSFLMIE